MPIVGRGAVGRGKSSSHSASQTRLLTIGRRCCERFSQPRVRDQLSRIAADGSIKLPVRIVPTLLAERADGRMPVGVRHCRRGLDLAPAWPLAPRSKIRLRIAHRPQPAPTTRPTAVSGVLETLHSGLGDDSALVQVIIQQMQALAERDDHKSDAKPVEARPADRISTAVVTRIRVGCN